MKNLNRNAPETNIFKNTTYLGTALFICFTVLNTSQFGASLSWVLIPCLLIIIGGMTQRGMMVKRAKLLYIIFWGICCLSTCLSRIVSPERDLLTFAVFIIVYLFSTSSVFTTEQVRFLNRIHLYISVYCAINILIHFVKHEYYNEWFKRASFSFLGVYKDPNYVMAFIIPAMMINLFRIINLDKKEGKIYIIFEIILISSFLTTGSRSSVLSFSFAVLTMILFNSDLSSKIRIRIVLIASFILLFWKKIVGFVLPKQSLERFMNVENDSRKELWNSALEVFYDYPVIGGGINSASVVSLKNAGNYSHNVYIDILTSCGLIGASIFVIFFFKNCMRTQRKNAGFMYSMIVAYMAPLFFINGFNTATYYLPLIMLSILSDLCQKEVFELKTIL